MKAGLRQQTNNGYLSTQELGTWGRLHHLKPEGTRKETMLHGPIKGGATQKTLQL